MRIEDIEIHAGSIERPYRVLGPITAQARAATLFSKTPTLKDVNSKLREVALGIGANAVIGVQYERGISATSWKVLTAKGTAVIAETDEIKCPSCAELVKREAIKCRHCGANLRVPVAAELGTPGKCGNCGAAVAPGSNFCVSCGRPLASAS
jgi:Double zinc ribbon/Putative heavy-metal-binding